MKNTFDYSRARAYLRSGSRTDLFQNSGSQSGSLKPRMRVMMLVPAFGLTLAAAILIGSMLAGSPLLVEGARAAGTREMFAELGDPIPQPSLRPAVVVQPV